MPMTSATRHNKVAGNWRFVLREIGIFARSVRLKLLTRLLHNRSATDASPAYTATITRSTQPCTPFGRLGLLIRVPALLG